MSNIELQKEIAVLQTTIQGMSEQLAEANKMQAEQQAIITHAYVTLNSCEESDYPEHTVAAVVRYLAKEVTPYELEVLLAKAKEEGRAEAQARIKVLEDAAKRVLASPYSKSGIEFIKAMRGLEQALSTTSPTEALDKVVREAKAQALEEAATYLEGDGAAFDDVQTLRERAEAIRRIEP